MALNPRQRKFVNEIAKGRKKGAAAKKAGYPTKGASVAASHLLKNPKVRQAISKQVEAIAEKAALTAADVLAQMRRLTFVDLSKAYAADGSLLHPHDMPEDVRQALQAVETDELFGGRGKKKRKIGLTRKIKLTDKMRSLEMLAKHFKLLTDVQEISGKDGGPQVILHLPSNGSEADDSSEK